MFFVNYEFLSCRIISIFAKILGHIQWWNSRINIYTSKIIFFRKVDNLCISNLSKSISNCNFTCIIYHMVVCNDIFAFTYNKSTSPTSTSKFKFFIVSYNLIILIAIYFLFLIVFIFFFYFFSNFNRFVKVIRINRYCLLYTSPSPRD